MNEKLKHLQEKMSAYRHALTLLNYDGETTAPKGTAENRAHAMSFLSEEFYKLSVGSETDELLESLDKDKENLTPEDVRCLELLLKNIRDMKKIPMEEFIAYSQLRVASSDVWHRAKVENDWEAFKPYLEKIIETEVRFAGHCAPEKDPYDYMLDSYEEGLTQKTCDEFFDTLRSRLVPLIKKIQDSPQVDDSILHGPAPVHKQEEFAYYLMDLIGLDRDHCGLSTTEHPFTTSLGSHYDVRITTHYYPEDFSDSMFSVIHEGGHALYDQNPKAEYAYTVLDGGVSMGVHESQSRFYENILGRSREFINLIYPKLKELFPQVIGDADPEQVYKAINKVQPSLIRIASDEVTYSLHVMVRYELEKRLVSGQLKVDDLPEEWNRLYKEYLGVDVPDYTRGVLQDSHWSTGLLGYFPSYALGSAYGAQLLSVMKNEVDVESAIKAGDLSPINAWNKEHIWQHGHFYKPAELLERAFGGPFNPQHYVDYLEKKYSDIYGF